MGTLHEMFPTDGLMSCRKDLISHDTHVPVAASAPFKKPSQSTTTLQVLTMSPCAVSMQEQRTTMCKITFHATPSSGLTSAAAQLDGDCTGMIASVLSLASFERRRSFPASKVDWLRFAIILRIKQVGLLDETAFKLADDIIAIGRLISPMIATEVTYDVVCLMRFP